MMRFQPKVISMHHPVAMVSIILKVVLIICSHSTFLDTARKSELSCNAHELSHFLKNLHKKIKKGTNNIPFTSAFISEH